jgi:predicted lipoprotein with Yx(FWY)xxD motif
MSRTIRSRRRSVMSWTVVAVAGITLLAGCGSGSGGTSTSTPTASATHAAAAGGAAVATGKTSVGTVLVDGNGMTLYAFAADSKDHSNCTGSCATYWPPVKADAAALGHPDGVTGTLGTTMRSDGSTQLTVDGWPMYTYAGDSKPGQATGQGKNLSGGLWWVVAPSGTWIKDTAGTSGSGGGRYGY